MIRRNLMKSIRIIDPCIACRKMGAVGRGYAYINLLGKEFAMCYRHLQVIAKVGRPQKDSTYQLEDPTALGPTGCGIPKCATIYKGINGTQKRVGPDPMVPSYSSRVGKFLVQWNPYHDPDIKLLTHNPDSNL